MTQHDIYLSSSWKNRVRVRTLADMLRAEGISAYDFTDPRCRDSEEIPPEKSPVLFDPAVLTYEAYLNSMPYYRAAVEGNRKALDVCRAIVLILPCGNDAHADWAYGVGRGKPSVVLGHPGKGERTPTHLWAQAMVQTDEEAVAWCARAMNAWRWPFEAIP